MTVADYEHQSLARVIDGAAELAHDPASCEVCGALGLRQHLHDLATCVGIVAESGRCADCGRLVAFAAHKRGGCLYAVPFVGTALWLFQHREGIPIVGQLLWRHRRRITATVAGIAAPTATIPGPVSAAGPGAGSPGPASVPPPRADAGPATQDGAS